MTESKAPKIQTTFEGCYNYNKLKAEGMVDDWRYSEENYYFFIAKILNWFML